MEKSIIGLQNLSVVTKEETQTTRKITKPDSPDKDCGSPSYTAMIAQAIMTTTYKRATLSEIYEYMNKAFEILQKRGTGWRNCVRHTLSLNECFVKLHRPENGRSCNWTIHPSYFDSFSKGDYRKRRVNRKKGRSVSWLEDQSLKYSPSLPYLREDDINTRGEVMNRMGQNSHHAYTTWHQTYPHVSKPTHYPSHSVPPSYSYDSLYTDVSNLAKLPTTLRPPTAASMPAFPTYHDNVSNHYSTLNSHDLRVNSSPIDSHSSFSRYSPSAVPPVRGSFKISQRQTYPPPHVNIEYNQESPCQHYGIDPSCYSSFSTRLYRQEYF